MQLLGFLKWQIHLSQNGWRIKTIVICAAFLRQGKHVDKTNYSARAHGYLPDPARGYFANRSFPQKHPYIRQGVSTAEYDGTSARLPLEPFDALDLTVSTAEYDGTSARLPLEPLGRAWQKPIAREKQKRGQP